MSKCLLCLLLFVFTFTGCNKKFSKDDLSLLTDRINEFYSAIENDDHQKRISLFDDNAKMLPDEGTIIEGKDAISKIVTGDGIHLFKIKDRKVIEIDISENLAYTVNSYFYAYYKKGDEPVWHKTKNVHIWKKDSGNIWKLHLDIWNSDGV